MNNEKSEQTQSTSDGRLEKQLDDAQGNCAPAGRPSLPRLNLCRDAGLCGSECVPSVDRSNGRLDSSCAGVCVSCEALSRQRAAGGGRGASETRHRGEWCEHECHRESASICTWPPTATASGSPRLFSWLYAQSRERSLPQSLHMSDGGLASTNVLSGETMKLRGFHFLLGKW